MALLEELIRNLIESLGFVIDRLNWLSVLDLAIVTLVFFGTLILLLDTKAVVLLRGILLLVVLGSLLNSTQVLPAFSWLVRTTLPALVLAIPVIFAPEIPWAPADAHTPLERAVYDPGGRFLAGFLAGLRYHLAPGGEAFLVLCDLAERLGLREPGTLEAAFAGAGLRRVEARTAPAAHARAKDPDDPLHEARAGEVTALHVLRPA